MPPFYRILEVAVYSLLNFLPYIFLAIYPFHTHLRFGKPATHLLIALVSLIQMMLGILAAFSPMGSGLLSAISTVIYATFYFAVVKVYWGKCIFMLLMLSNISNFVVSISKCIEGVIAYDLAIQNYRWTFSLVMLVMEALYLIPLFFYIKKIITPIFLKKSNRPLFRYLWMIPAIFYFIWFYHLYTGKHGSSLELTLSFNHSIFLLIVNLGAMLIYQVTAKLLYQMNDNEALAEKNHLLSLQELQYENLQSRIAEARQAKHDIRHHITMMSSYLQSGEYDKLREYLHSYQKSLPDDSAIVFCANRTVNTLLLYFAQQSKNERIDYDVAVSIPEKLPIAENVLSVVLGNLLENAVEAASETSADIPKIVIRGKYENNALFLRIDNSYDGKLKRAKDGTYLSTKHAGRGIGLSSVQNILRDQGGMIEISSTDKLFSVSILLRGETA